MYNAEEGASKKDIYTTCIGMSSLKGLITTVIIVIRYYRGWHVNSRRHRRFGERNVECRRCRRRYRVSHLCGSAMRETIHDENIKLYYAQSAIHIFIYVCVYIYDVYSYLYMFIICFGVTHKLTRFSGWKAVSTRIDAHRLRPRSKNRSRTRKHI